MDEVCDFIVNNVNVEENIELSSYIHQNDDDEIDNQDDELLYISTMVNHIMLHLNIKFGDSIQYISATDGDTKAFVSFIYKNRKCIIEDYYSSRGYSYWNVRLLPVNE